MKLSKHIIKLIKERFHTYLYILVFDIFFFIIEIIILNKITTLYYVDVYKFIYQANEIAQTGNFFSYTSRSFPFIWILSLIIKITSPIINDPILISKLTMLFINFLHFFQSYYYYLIHHF